MQGCGQLLLLLLLLLVEVLYQLLLRASLGYHGELSNHWLLSCRMYCLKLSRRKGARKEEVSKSLFQSHTPQSMKMPQ